MKGVNGMTNLIGKVIRVHGIPAYPENEQVVEWDVQPYALYGHVEVEDFVSDNFGDVLHVTGFNHYTHNRECFAIRGEDIPEEGFEPARRQD